MKKSLDWLSKVRTFWLCISRRICHFGCGPTQLDPKSNRRRALVPDWTAAGRWQRA